jgi:Carboxypeptidase regulatory-like domain/TonB dependent receptor
MKRRILLVILLALVGPPLFAQATAAFNGRVVDPQGAILAGATVKAMNVGTGATRSVVTNGDGLYSITALDFGVYELTVSSSGFAPTVEKGVRLAAGSTLTLDFNLGISGVAQQVEVSSAAPMIETSESEVAASLQATEVQELPMLTRSLAAMVTLLPGAREVAASGSHNYISFGGSAGRNFNMLVDGVDNHEDEDGGTVMNYSLEGIQESRVLLHDFSAEYGRGAATVIVATKEGTNRLHGSAFGYGRSDALTATDYFSEPSNGGLGKPPYNREQYGGSINGPILKNRIFYAGSFERTSQLFTQSVASTIYDQMLFLAPLNIGAVPTQSVSQPFRDMLIQAKTNFQISKNHSGFVRYSSDGSYVINSGLGTAHTLLSCCGVADDNLQHMWDGAIGETWVISPSTINQFSLQYIYYNHTTDYASCTDSGVIAYNPPFATSQAGVDACRLQALSFPSVTTGVENAAPFTNQTKRGQIKDDFSKQIGRNAIKFGGDFSHYFLYGGNFAVNSPGTITFFDDPGTIVNNTNGEYPEGFATPGIVRTMTATALNYLNYAEVNPIESGMYVQDDITVAPRLTLNLGLRYDFWRFMSQTSIQPLNRVYQVLKALDSPFGALPHTSHDFGPHVGLAWDIKGNGKDVIRAGFGMFYSTPVGNSFYQQVQLEKPTLYYTSALTDSAIQSGPLANYVYNGPNATPLTLLSPPASANLPTGQSVTGNWFDPRLRDAYAIESHIGYSHEFNPGTVISADYTHIHGVHGWRNLDINPICSANFQGVCGIPGYPVAPLGTRILAPALQAMYGDPALLGPVDIVSSVNKSQYDEFALHFERRYDRVTFQVNYTLAWANGLAGSLDTSTEGTTLYPEIPSAIGGCIQCKGEWGPGSYDERNRVALAGVFKLPFHFQASPTFTAAGGRPYQQYRATNPDGDGSLRCYVNNCINGSGPEVSVNAARGNALVSLNARLTRGFSLPHERRIDLFAEMYNITNRANFGTNYGTAAYSPTTFNKPTSYLGGGASTTTIPNSFQTQLGARFAF